MCPSCYRLSVEMRRELARWCLPARRHCTHCEDSARLRVIEMQAWLRDLDKQDPAGVGPPAGSTDLHSVAGSFGGCSSHFGTA
jgi:hypothetical protein